MNVVLIVAVDENFAIGIKGDQPAYLSEDLKRFKQLTTGHVIVMGRKTFDALPKGALPNRRNIVMTHNPSLQLPGCEMAHTVDQVLDMCREEREIFIIGGGQIYKEFLPIANQIKFTKILKNFANVDTWFPQVDRDEWISVENSSVKVDEKSGISYRYETWSRKV